jgi:hypothetical protein
MTKISGSFLYKDLHTTQQVPNIKSFFEKLLINESFNIVIELGTSLGGLTYIIDDIKQEFNLNYTIHTFDYSYKDYVEKQLNQRGCFYYNLDERDEEYRKTVINLLKNNGKALLLCDGGNKIEEFNLYSQFLKNHDFIMAHDYCYDSEIFHENIENKYWNWFEISYNDIKESIDKNHLIEYKLVDFEYAAWACFKKGII